MEGWSIPRLSEFRLMLSSQRLWPKMRRCRVAFISLPFLSLSSHFSFLHTLCQYRKPYFPRVRPRFLGRMHRARVKTGVSTDVSVSLCGHFERLWFERSPLVECLISNLT